MPAGLSGGRPGRRQGACGGPAVWLRAAKGAGLTDAGGRRVRGQGWCLVLAPGSGRPFADTSLLPFGALYGEGRGRPAKSARPAPTPPRCPLRSAGFPALRNALPGWRRCACGRAAAGRLASGHVQVPCEYQLSLLSSMMPGHCPSSCSAFSWSWTGQTWGSS